MSAVAWGRRFAPSEAAAVVRRALSAGLLEGQPAAIFHDLGRMRARIEELHRAFPVGTLHTLAVKANPLVPILRAAVAAGAGLECASIEELHLSLVAGCAPDQVVFDSPAKTREELAFALERGVLLNADSVAELERIDALLASVGTAPAIGLRINPEVGAGSIASTSVADQGSRFGVRLVGEHEAVLEAFRRFRWLTGIHVHVGSQGCSLDMLLEAAVRAAELREEIHIFLGERRIEFVDIGGGLPAAYREEDRPPGLVAYADALRGAAASLFEDDARIVTEFGRSVQAGCGFAVSRVEYVKETGHRPVAVIHLGGDFLVRPVYCPDDWAHEWIALQADGRIKGGPRRAWDIAGPLCFGGDLPARAVPLPGLTPGDLLVIRDVGAYTLSMWSRHCSRGIPRVIGIDGDQLCTLRERELPDDVVRFWSG